MLTYKIDPGLKFKKPEELMDLPITVTVNDFTEASAKLFRDELNKAMNFNKTIIPIVIDSFGGQVYSLLSMIDQVKKTQKEGFTVATISTGKSMSCGAMLLSMGSEGHRYVNENSTLMIHEVSLGAHGKLEEVKVSVEEGKRINDLIFKLMAENVGKPRDYFVDIMHQRLNADWFLDPEECVKHNLANHIGNPKFNIKVTADISFGL
jgi:ATP-dependent Clp endopeptidase proteolytic subunit ClpP